MFPPNVRLFVFIWTLLLQSHLLLDLGNGVAGVKTLGARSRAVENRVASIQAHRVVEGVLSLGLPLVTGVDDPSVGLEENGGSQVLLGVPPVGRARC